MDDEQGPWWTRPAEPGPQAPAVQRRRTSGQQDVDVEYPPTEAAFADTTVIYPATGQVPAEPAAEPAPADHLPAGPDDRRSSVEPPAPPRPTKPPVRRVAVVRPTPPQVRTVGQDPRDQRTESLPPVGDDIFATFSGPLPLDPGGSPNARGAAGHPPAAGTGDPLEGHRQNRAAELLSQVKQVNLPEPRVLLLAAAGALVVLLIVIVALVSGRGAKDDQPGRSPTAGPSAVIGPNELPGRTPDGLTQLGAADATALLRKAGQGPGGSIVEAWSWNDQNGRNLVVESIAPAGANKRTLRVIHVAGLDGDARRLRLMQDPDLPADCDGGGAAGFTPKAMIVRDLDSDDVAEVISGWSSRCGGGEARSQIRLALITNGEKYILRGQGVIGEAGGFTPAPRPSRWPDGYLKQLGAQYRKLYG